jgi:hypothetical protein
MALIEEWAQEDAKNAKHKALRLGRLFAANQDRSWTN